MVPWCSTVWSMDTRHGMHTIWIPDRVYETCDDADGESKAERSELAVSVRSQETEAQSTSSRRRRAAAADHSTQ